jgi:hypothetical protein
MTLSTLIILRNQISFVQCVYRIYYQNGLRTNNGIVRQEAANRETKPVFNVEGLSD